MFHRRAHRVMAGWLYEHVRAPGDPDAAWAMQLQALAVHSHLRSLPDDRQVEHVTGFKFVALDDPTVVDAIDRLLDVAMAAFGFDWTAVDVHGPL